MIPGPCCLNCEEKKNTPYPIIIDQRSGYICNECYNANIWASKDQGFYPYSLLKELYEKEEDSQPYLRLLKT